MGTEIVRRNNNGLVPVSDARRVMDAALAQLRGGITKGEIIQPVRREVGRPVEQMSGEVIDLPRICAVHDRPYVSRYVLGANGRYGYGQGIRFTDSLSDQYESQAGNPQRLPVRDIAEERCPWCGACGYAAVFCEDCGTYVCFGRTDAKRHFHCRKSCGSEGRLVDDDNPEMRGLRPHIGPGGPYSSFR